MSTALTSFVHCQQLIAAHPDKCKEIVQHFLQNIVEKKALNTFVRTYDEEALAQAEATSQKIQQGTSGSLAGLVVGLKDMFCYKDHPLQASSHILNGFVSLINATSVQRLLDQDAIIIGHQNCDEFGMGSANENSIYGPVHNALDPTRVSGGSSGGSAVGVQAHMCHVALGTDTGGSVRQPAAFCGLVGLKPTYSRISRYGVIAYASSFDTVGILAHNIPDCAAVLEAIAGVDAYDNTSSTHAVPNYKQQLAWDKKVRIAYFKQTLTHEALQPAIKERTEHLFNTLKAAGHEVVGVDFPLLEYALPTYYVLTTAEASANLARYDGVRYGHRSASASTLHELYKQTRTQGFGKEVQRRILLGTFVLSSDYYDDHYVQAQKVRRLIKESMEVILASYDFIMLPTTPTTAFLQGSHAQDPITQYLADLYTVPASIAGLPAISVPNGTDQSGLPIGVQIIAGAFQEKKLLAFAQHVLDT